MFKKALFALVLFALSFWVYSSNKPIQPTLQTQKLKSASHETAQTNNAAQTTTSPLEKKLHDEASLVGRIDSAPDDTEVRLQEWAQTLSPSELEELEQTALNTQKPQDDRFLAVMLMAWSEKAEALDNLKDIALSEIDPYLSPNRMGDFERILRMQAVDGMIDLPAQNDKIENTLKSVASKTGETSIADRAHRALWALRGDAPSPKDQDHDALERVLKKSKRN